MNLPSDAFATALQMIEELVSYCPSSDEFDHGFGLDFALAIPHWIAVAPEVIRHLLFCAENLPGVKRGHLLGLVFIVLHYDIEELRPRDRNSLAQEITEAIQGGYPLFLHCLGDAHCLVRYWSIWGVWTCAKPDAGVVLAAHLAQETNRENRDVILRLIDPNWQLPSPVVDLDMSF